MRLVKALVLSLGILALAGASEAADGDRFTENEIVQKANDFFGATTEGLATAIQKVFADLGQPNAYIEGEEASGAFVVGVRYGKGRLNVKGGVQGMQVYWQGPSVGFDVGGNAAKVFTLIYDLPRAEDLFQRFPGVDGSAYFIAGLGVNYARSGQTTVAPIRTGGGLRLGANVGYIHFTREASWNPL